jgi:hypothetical protein
VNFFKEKKNLPIIVGVLVVLILGGAGAGLYFAGMLPWSAKSPSAASSQPQPSPAAETPPVVMPSGPPVKPVVASGDQAAAHAKSKPLGGTAPLAAARAASRAKSAQAAAKPKAVNPALVAYVPPTNILKGPDPFKIPPAPYAPKTAPVWVSSAPPLPGVYIARYPTPVTAGGEPVRPLTIDLAGKQTLSSARVSGIIQTDTGVQAILETNGQSQAVQPGDQVADGKVISIQSDGLTLRRPDGSVVVVPLNGGNSEESQPQNVSQNGQPPWQQNNGALPGGNNGRADDE